MNINQQLSLETKLPFLTVLDFRMEWEINRHARFQITGIAKNHSSDAEGSLKGGPIGLKLMLSETGEILFDGPVEKLEVIRESKAASIRAEARSASVMLDITPLKRVFQNPSQTYSGIAAAVAGEAGGKIICTTGNMAVGRPFICYQETAWQFTKRLASQIGSFIVADVVTGQPNLWFGMRRGKETEVDLSSWGIRIRKDYADGSGRPRKYCFLESSKNLLLGDRILLRGRSYMIYRKEAYFQRGELNFRYALAEEETLRTRPCFNESITGLSLGGTVKETKGERFRLQFDIDKDSQGCFFPWKPETGNALYAMPETGASVEVYFPDHDEKNGIGIRCWEQSPESRTHEDKYMKTPNKAVLKLAACGLEIQKSSQAAKIEDVSIHINGSQAQLQAQGRVRLKAQRIALSSASEIRATTER